MKNLTIKTLFIMSSLFFISNVNATQYVFPENGQSNEQQQQDEYSCHSWAVTQTGVDPTQGQTKVAPTEPVPDPVPQGAKRGSGIRGALGGAAAGAIIAEVGGNDVSNGAAKGAAIGAVSSRRQSRKAATAQANEQQQAAQQQTVQAQQVSNEQSVNYNKARNVCLDAKGYSVSN